MASRKIEVQIVGDAKSLERAFGKAAKSGSSFGRSLGKVAKFGALAVGGAGIGGLAAVLKVGISEFSQASKVAAQTAAVLESTGGVANVTAKQVDALSGALMRKSGIDDEQIKTGQNMLLTFTKIRNEVGKGNDIFDQATKATLDMSVAMGKDMQSSAILVGKALNDPVKGMTALSKAGIQFTAAQKESIKSMVESGNVMGAQKMILAELTTQFGGSAEALGNTVPGQINRLRESFSNLSGQIVTSLVPSFVKILDWTTANWPTIERVVKTVFAALGAAIGTLAGFFRTHWASISAAVTTAINTVRAVSERVWPRVQEAAARVVAWYRGTLQPAIQNVLAALRAFWARFGEDITRIATVAFNTVRTVVGAAMRVIQGVIEAVLAAIRGDWSQVWSSLKQVVSNVLKGVGAIIRGFVSIAFTAMKAVGAALVDGIIAGASSIGERLGGFLKDKIGGAISAVKGAFGIRSPSKVTADQIGRPLAEGIVQGLDGGLQLLMPKAIARLKAYTDKLEAQARAARSRLESAMGGLSDKLFRAFDAETGGTLTPAEAQIAAISKRRRGEDLQRALADAQASGDSQAIARATEDIQLAALEEQAANERKAWEDQRAAMRERLDGRLKQLSTHFSKEGATVKSALAAIQKLMLQFGVSFEDAGAFIGQHFARGLAGAVAGTAGGAASVRGARTGGDSTVVVNLPNYLGSEREVAQVIRQELVRVQRRGGQVAI